MFLRRTLTTSSLSLRVRARNRHTRRSKTNSNAVVELAKLNVRLRHATSIAVLPSTLNECVELGYGEVVLYEVAWVMGNRWTAVRAGLCMVVVVAVECTETLPAEIKAATSAYRRSVNVKKRCPERRGNLQFM